MNEENEKKNIEIVQGIGNLDISPVYDNLTIAKPKMQDEKPKNIVIPQVKKVEKKQEDKEEKTDVCNEENTESENIKDDGNLVDIVEEDDFVSDEDNNIETIAEETDETDSELAEGEQIEFDDFDFDDDATE